MFNTNSLRKKKYWKQKLILHVIKSPLLLASIHQCQVVRCQTKESHTSFTPKAQISRSLSTPPPAPALKVQAVALSVLEEEEGGTSQKNWVENGKDSLEEIGLS